MTARDNVRKWMIADHKDALLDEYRAEVLREAITAARSECLTDDTGTPEDDAYNQGVNDAVVAIRELLNAAVSGSTAGDERPETDVSECRCKRDRDGNGEGWIHYQARDGEFVELRCRDHEGGAR